MIDVARGRDDHRIASTQVETAKLPKEGRFIFQAPEIEEKSIVLYTPDHRYGQRPKRRGEAVERLAAAAALDPRLDPERNAR
jgi:hypothetical protein